MKKKLIAFALVMAMAVGVCGAFTACGPKVDETKVFRIVALDGGRGSTYINKLVDDFKKDDKYKGVTFEVNMIKNANLAAEVKNMVNSGKNIDLLGVNFGTKEAIIETMVKDKNLVDLSDVLEMTVPGETKKVKDKLADGILNNYTCRPYGNGKTYSLPSFYSPTGLFYDASRFGTGTDKYALPTNMTEFFTLGDTLNTSRAATPTTPHLFTYPTAGYFDGVVTPIIASFAGIDKMEKTLGYEDGIWQDADVKNALKQIVKLKPYLLPTTVANANNEGFKNNQQAVIGFKKTNSEEYDKGTALFIPNGDWLPGEMSKTTPAGFEWGFMAWPKNPAAGSKAYTNSYIENWEIHTSSDNQNIGKDFLAYYYSDKAAKIVATESKAIVPTKEALINAKANGVPDSTIAMYDLYKTAGVVVSSYVATAPVEDTVWNDIIYGKQIDAMMTSENKKTEDEILDDWSAKLEAASDKFRAKIIK